MPYRPRPDPADDHPRPVPLDLLAMSAAFGVPASAWLAHQRARPIVLWAVYGGILGPLSVVLLLVAPPGRCPRCDAPVDGWPRRCAVCDTVLSSMPFARQRGPARPTPRHPRRAMATPAAPRGRSSPVPSATDAAAAPDAAVTPTRATTQKADPTGAAGGSRAEAGRLAHSMGSPPGGMAGANSIGAAVGRPGEPIAAASAPSGRRKRRGGPSASDVTVLTDGIFVAGTYGLDVGGRYAIGILGGALAVVGPLDTGADRIALRRAGPVEAQPDGDRLIVSVPGSALSLAFARPGGSYDPGVTEAFARATAGGA